MIDRLGEGGWATHRWDVDRMRRRRGAVPPLAGELQPPGFSGSDRSRHLDGVTGSSGRPGTRFEPEQDLELRRRSLPGSGTVLVPTDGVHEVSPLGRGPDPGRVDL